MQKNGYITILIVLVISAAAIVIGTTVSLLAIGQMQSGYAVTQGESALAITEGCMEDALLNVKDNPAYAGGTITRPEGTCTITVTKAGNVWTLTATTTTGSYRRTVKVVATRSWRTVVNSWQEI